MVKENHERALIQGLPVKASLRDVKQMFKPVRVKDIHFLKNGYAVVYFKNENVKNECLKKNYTLFSKELQIHDYVENLFDNENESNSKKTFPKVDLDEIREEILDSGRLYVRNLSYDVTEKDLEDLFSPFGKLSEVHLPFDNQSSRNMGFGYITFMFPNEALKAHEKLDKTRFKNRLMHILPSKEPVEKPKHESDAFNEEFLTNFQRKHMSKLKKTANVAFNWNSLFVSPDAVATYLSHKLGTSKEKVFQQKKADASNVLLAQAEISLLKELKDSLQRQGVQLDLLTEEGLVEDERRDKSQSVSCNTKHVLSGNTFLVKNLPVGTDEKQLCNLIRVLVENYDENVHKPSQIICPSLGVTAIMVYAQPQAAKTVYSALAYEKYQDNVLMVQWAPENLIDTTKNQVKKEATENSEWGVSDEELVRLPTHGEIRNLMQSSSTILDREKQAEQEEMDKSERKAAKLTKDYGKKSALKRKAKEDETAAEEFEIVKQPMEDKPEKKKPKLQESDDAKANHVITVKNISFQGNEAELKQLFEPVGGLTAVRMPRKPAGGHRGFAFIEFVSLDKAREAMAMFKETHFLGRRLRLEYQKSI